jgi:hypothetical protein
MRHQDLTINHILESWVYANAAARTGATGFVAGDIGRIAYQSDNGTYWRLTATTPTWASLQPLAYASLLATAGNPTGTASTAFVMMGLGGTFKITPTATGKMHILIQGYLFGTVASVGMLAQLRYGTGAAPANGAAAAGTGIGNFVQANNSANAGSPFCLSGIVTGMALGTQYWIDLAIASSNATQTTAVGAPVLTAFETP